MTKEEILKAAEAAEEAAKVEAWYDEGDFIIGSKIDELLPNGKMSTLVCVDCSWLKRLGQKPIIEDLDPIEIGLQSTDSITMERELDMLSFTKWVDMVDVDGDVHHCKVVSYIELSIDVFHPVEDPDDWIIYVEV